MDKITQVENSIKVIPEKSIQQQRDVKSSQVIQARCSIMSLPTKKT